MQGHRVNNREEHGRKIEKAVELVQAGAGVLIVSEEHWSRSLI
jgi:hypothetical protein